MMDMFAWLVKVRCYLQVGKNMAAYVLVRQLIPLLEPGKRYMDLCECHMLLAIIHHKAGDREREQILSQLSAGTHGMKPF